MVFVAPDPSQVLGPALQQLMEGINHVINPNFAFQQSMKHALGTNPELAQQLADLETNAPGSLQRLGFGDELTKTIGAIPQTINNQVTQGNRATLVDTKNKQIQTADTQAGFDLGRLNDTIKFLADPNNKDIKADEILKRLTGQTGSERATAGSEATIKEAEAGTAPAYYAARTSEAGSQATSAAAAATAAPAKAAAEIAGAGAEVAKAGVAKQAYQQALENLPNLKNVDFMRMAREAASGQLNMSTAAATLATPGAGKAFQMAMRAVEEEKQRGLQMFLHAQQGKDHADNMLTTEAFQRYQATKGAGTLDAWKQVLSSPKMVNDIRAKNPATLTQDDKDILHAADANDMLQDREKLNSSRTLNASIAADMGRLETAASKGEGPEAINTYLSNLNTSLAQKASITGETYTARFGARPEVGDKTKTMLGTWGEGSGLYYVDKDGNRVDPAKVFADPMTGGAQLNALAMRTYATLQSLPAADRQKQLLRVQKEKPEVYNLIKGMIK